MRQQQTRRNPDTNAMITTANIGARMNLLSPEEIARKAEEAAAKAKEALQQQPNGGTLQP
jgi:hypothetical protein